MTPQSGSGTSSRSSTHSLINLAISSLRETSRSSFPAAFISKSLSSNSSSSSSETEILGRATVARSQRRTKSLGHRLDSEVAN